MKKFYLCICLFIFNCSIDKRIEKPNIIVIMADDLGYGDVGAYGAKAENVKTPNIDKLAEGGIKFTSGYCSASTCTPTRYSFLTGSYAFRKKNTGIAPPNAPAIIKPGTETIATVLKKAGYATNPKYPSLLIDLIEKYDLSRFDKSSAQQKNFYFAHSYGLPYLSGIGAYYFNKKSLYFTEVNTSFVFSDANLGYHYELLDNFYTGVNAGIIYLPTKEETIITQIAAELMYKKSSKKQQYNSVLIRGGVQLPLMEIDYQFIPYLRLIYLFK